MSGPHPLNHAVVAQALHDLRTGQFRRCLSMGFGERELQALKHPAMASLLSNASVAWCSITVNCDVVQHLMQQLEDIELEVETVDRMLRLGASTEMVSEFFGLTHQEVALRRGVLGLPKRKGRHPALSEAQDVQLWEHWHAQCQQRGLALNDERAQLTLTLDLAETLALPASVVWAALLDWIKPGTT